MPVDLSHYVATRTLPDGRICGVMRLLYHWTLHIDISEWAYEDRYCYATLESAMIGLNEWTGEGDPPGGWHRHPTTMRRRPDGDPAREYIHP